MVRANLLVENSHRNKTISITISFDLIAFTTIADKAKIVYSPAEVFLAFGKSGTLDCHFHANPPLTKIRWEKDGFLFDTYNVPGVYHKLNGSLYFNRASKILNIAW